MHPTARHVVRVLLCDDSAIMRGMIARILEAEPAICVVALATNGQAALDALNVNDVDVVVLNVEMPTMDGLTALPLLLAAQPGLSVIMASSLTTRGASTSMQALRLGAADYVTKPSASAPASEAHFGTDLIAKILARPWQRPPPVAQQHSTLRARTAIAVLRPAPSRPPSLLAIGCSTGGPNALISLIRSLPPDLPVPVLITQHMPASFTALLAERLNRIGGLPCAQASDGAELEAGRILLAPGDFHMLVRATRASLCIELSRSAPVNFCRPAVDPMLASAAEATDGRVLAVILTGMGSDGMEGVRRVVNRGGAAIVQDEATSVVWGMPGAVARAGLAHAVLPLPQIGPRITSMLGARP